MFYKIGAVLILLLVAACGYFAWDAQVAKTRNETLQVELKTAKDDLERQQKLADQLRADKEKQEKLLEEFKQNVDDIRKEANDALTVIENTDYGKEANTNAAELERIINERTKQLLDSITRVSQGEK